MKEITRKLQISYLVSQILNSSFDKAIEIYAHNFHSLADYDFIFTHPEAQEYFVEEKKLKLEGFNITSFYISDHLYFINADSFIHGMLNVPHKEKIVTAIALDTQILSYIYRLYCGQEKSVPANINEIIKLIRKRKYGIDFTPYLYENALFNPDFIETQIYKDNIFACEQLFHKTSRKARKYCNLLAKHERKFFNTSSANHFRRMYKLIYLSLLVMVNIQLDYRNLSLFDKEEKILSFFHNEIFIVPGREINLAKLYFMYGQNIRFFGKIQKGRKDLIPSIKNMAWDIFHLNTTIESCTIREKRADFVLPAFVTCDQRLKDVEPIYKLKRYAYNKSTMESHAIYNTNLLDPYLENKYLTICAYQVRLKTTARETEESMIELIDLHIKQFEERMY